MQRTVIILILQEDACLVFSLINLQDFALFLFFFAELKRYLQLNSLQSHRHRPMEQVILVRSVLAV